MRWHVVGESIYLHYYHLFGVFLVKTCEVSGGKCLRVFAFREERFIYCKSLVIAKMSGKTSRTYMSLLNISPRRLFMLPRLNLAWTKYRDVCAADVDNRVKVCRFASVVFGSLVRGVFSERGVLLVCGLMCRVRMSGAELGMRFRASLSVDPWKRLLVLDSGNDYV